MTGLRKANGLWRVDPVMFARDVLGFDLQPFQAAALDMSVRRGILNCSRQSGKTLVMALKAVHLACAVPNKTIAVLSPTSRQCGEFFEKVREILGRLDIRARGDGHNQVSCRLPNGSRLIGLPAGAKTRGVSGVSLLLVDEAAEVPDKAFHAVTPMLATTAGKTTGGCWLISTPMGRRGFFWQIWSEGGDKWLRLKVPASDCPRIDTEFLEMERESKGEQRFLQEYCCEFVDTPDQLFTEDRIRAAVNRKVPKLWR